MKQLTPVAPKIVHTARTPSLAHSLRSFCEFGKSTVVTDTLAQSSQHGCVRVETYVNEFWTPKQRDAHNLHEISYRACFKPQLPRFFIERLTQPGDRVYDPFMGRGTTLLEAALLERIPAGCDVNPLSAILLQPRLRPPTLSQVADRLAEIDLADHEEFPEDLLVFYHRATLKEICALKKYLAIRDAAGATDDTDRWIRMVAVNRLTGHSRGFFSVYTLPPNQAVSVESQKKINRDRNQKPPRREVGSLILRKTRSLIKDCDEASRKDLASVAEISVLLTQESRSTPQIPSSSVALVVTSPPFLDVVNYAQDNWLRCWFCGIDPKAVPITVLKNLDAWRTAMLEVFKELHRVLKPGGHIAFEVGEVRSGRVKLEEVIIPCGIEAGLEPLLVLINDQKFTKTAQCWGIDNNRKGTNTNRIVLFRKSL